LTREGKVKEGGGGEGRVDWAGVAVFTAVRAAKP